MPRLPSLFKALVCITTLFFSALTFAQSLAGPWDVIESGDGRGPVAGQMTLAPGGGVVFTGLRSTWQPNGSSVEFAILGAMQVPASRISMQWNGSVLQGTLTAYKYRMSGGQPVLESERSFPLSARRPEGYAAADTSSRQNAPFSGTATGGPTSNSRASSETGGISARAENAASNRASAGRAPQEMQSQLEGVALCWQNTRNEGKWGCDGPIQRLLVADETLEKALDMVGCKNPRLTDGSRTINNREHTVHLCGISLNSSDRDVVQRYGLTVQRNSYDCPKSQWRCQGSLR